MEGTNKQWLSDLLHAFNRGDIDQFNDIVGKNQAEFDAQPALSSKKEYVKEKVALLALMVLVFQRPAQERNIAFIEIAEVTRLPVAQVEWLVMRALSCKLIKGSIDQVDEIVRVSWVQVRETKGARRFVACASLTLSMLCVFSLRVWISHSLVCSTTRS